MSQSSNAGQQVLRIGILGLGEVAQVSHINALNSLSSYYKITYLCDASQAALDHCRQKVSGGAPRITTRPEELIRSNDVDVILICNVNAFHPQQTILALQNNKFVLVEKPLALNYRDLDAIIDAEKTSTAKVFVGYQRRYATAFLDAITEIGGMDKIEYIRVRDIIGQNSSFVHQSGTYPQRWTDFSVEETAAMRATEEEMVKTALVDEIGVEATENNMTMLRLFTGLGCHDFSALREMVGMPTKVLGTSLSLPIWNVLFQFDNFPVMYESGIIDVPQFDAHIEIYSRAKIVRVNYDTPYVKGLPVTLVVRTKVEGERGDGFEERIVRKTYEDAFTLEFLDFHRCAANRETPKTSAVDARKDQDLIKMILQASEK